MERPAPRSSRRQRSTTETRQDELREALSHVGELMQLPPKRPTEAAPVIKEAAAFRLPSTKGSKFWLPVIAGVMLAGVALFMLWPAAAPTVPLTLLGEWTTTNPKYAGNRIAISATDIRLTIADRNPTSHAIRGISTNATGDSLKVVINYQDEGGLTELNATLVTLPTRRLIFARPQGLVWDAVTK
ncbi:MAG: hypothetical protein K8S21_12965 [Gemmatimonadetes bacterium]|nr:hypothetical protein [Gemmatimonadota bacterium]